MSVFINPPESYRRQLDIVSSYIDDTALYISRMTNTPLDKAKEFVRDSIKAGGKFQANDRKALILRREENGDRVLVNTTFSAYMKSVINEELILAPNFTAYIPPKKKKSIIASYIGENLAKRKAFKKEMLSASLAEDKAREEYYDILQSTSKIKNNSVSGAHASPYQVLYNKSSHSTLTSTCRSATSYANCHNERFIMGNRFYWSYEVTLNNILSIINVTDMESVAKCVDELGLYLPNTDDCIDCIKYSSVHYWNDENKMNSLRSFIDTLTPYEKAAFLYVGDLYHLAKHNESYVRELLSDFSRRVEDPNIKDPLEVISKAEGDVITLASFLSAPILAGRELSKILKSDPEGFSKVASTVLSIQDAVKKHESLIKTFWITYNLPPTISGAPYLVRKCIPVSDTDSTIFTSQYWTQWYRGKLDFSEESYNIGYVITFFTAQIVRHYLAVMSANMGVDTKQLHQISMKNEYYFPIIGLTPLAKHYFSYISGREGNVYSKMKTEVKGVYLRSSAWPAGIKEKVEDYIRHLMDRVMENGCLTLTDIYKPIYDVEMSIVNDVKNRGYRYMSTGTIKEKEAYVNERSPYLHYDMWKKVFEPKYGVCEPPPYRCVKVSVELDKPRLLKEWLANIEDRELAARMEKWLADNGRDKLSNFMLPETVIQSSGIPIEIVEAFDIRKLLQNTMTGFYLVLKALGLYVMDTKMSQYVHEFWSPDPN